MSTSTSSFRGYTITVLLILLATVALPAAGVVAASEVLIRTKVIPNDRFSWQLDQMLSSRNTNVVFGDSHTMYGVHGLDGFFNLSMPDNVPGIEAKMLDYFADKDPGKVILGADIYLLSPGLENRTPIYKSWYRKNRIQLWALTKLHRNQVKTYWQLYLKGHNFENTYTFQPDGAFTRNDDWSQVPESERFTASLKYVEHSTPPDQPKETEAARSYQRMLEFLTSKGADVCLVRMPLTSQVRTMIAEAKLLQNFERAQIYYRSQASIYGATYVDLSGAITDDNLYVDQNHLNEAGAIEFAPMLQTACFGSSEND